MKTLIFYWRFFCACVVPLSDLEWFRPEKLFRNCCCNIYSLNAAKYTISGVVKSWWTGVTA